jgi:hypothetical protein
VLTQKALGHSSVLTTARSVSPDDQAASAAILSLSAPPFPVESLTGKEVALAGAASA